MLFVVTEWPGGTYECVCVCVCVRVQERLREREKEREKFFSEASQLRKLAYFSCQTASNSKLPSPNRFSAEAEAREQMKI